MGPVKRQPGDRRWGMPVQYPLTDCDGLKIEQDRRTGVDRRRSIASPEDLLILFSQLPSEDHGDKR